MIISFYVPKKGRENEVIKTLAEKLNMSQSQVCRLAIILLACKEGIAVATEIDDPIEKYLLEKN